MMLTNPIKRSASSAFGRDLGTFPRAEAAGRFHVRSCAAVEIARDLVRISRARAPPARSAALPPSSSCQVADQVASASAHSRTAPTDWATRASQHLDARLLGGERRRLHLWRAQQRPVELVRRRRGHGLAAGLLDEHPQPVAAGAVAPVARGGDRVVERGRRRLRGAGTQHAVGVERRVLVAEGDLQGVEDGHAAASGRERRGVLRRRGGHARQHAGQVAARGRRGIRRAPRAAAAARSAGPLRRAASGRAASRGGEAVGTSASGTAPTSTSRCSAWAVDDRVEPRGRGRARPPRPPPARACARTSAATTVATSSESSGGSGVGDEVPDERGGGSMSQAARTSGAASAEPSVVRRESGRPGTPEP